MKNLLFSLALLLLTGIGAQAQTGNIRFTVKRNADQPSQIQIYGKNFTASTLSGIIGASNITLCVTFPSQYTGNPIIASPIAGQTWEVPNRNKVGTDSVYAWNGLGSTAIVDFAPNIEVLLANVTFRSFSNVTTTVKIANIALGGPSTFDYCYIALSGTEHSGYSNPFYSNTAGDPLLQNAGGVNDPYAQLGSSLGVGNVSLPTKFLSFFATKSGDIANLTWTVENEENNAYFEVERSLDGRNFTKVSQVQALHNGRSSNTYTTPDANISRLGVKTIYYRIRQVETSGQVVYSEIRQVNLVDKNFIASLYPNPVKTSTKLVIDAPEAGKATVIIRDATGKKGKAISLQLVKGMNQQQLDATMFAAGDYNVTIASEKLNQTIKMTKAN